MSNNFLCCAESLNLLTPAPLVTISPTVLLLSHLLYSYWELLVSVIKNELYNLFREYLDIYYFKGLLKVLLHACFKVKPMPSSRVFLTQESNLSASSWVTIVVGHFTTSTTTRAY